MSDNNIIRSWIAPYRLIQTEDHLLKTWCDRVMRI